MWDLKSGECTRSYPLEIATESGGPNALAQTEDAFSHKVKI